MQGWDNRYEGFEEDRWPALKCHQKEELEYNWTNDRGILTFQSYLVFQYWTTLAMYLAANEDSYLIAVTSYV